jgi:hypothetical protein
LEITWVGKSIAMGIRAYNFISIYKSGLRVIIKWLTTCTSRALIKPIRSQHHSPSRAQEYILLK